MCSSDRISGSPISTQNPRLRDSQISYNFDSQLSGRKKRRFLYKTTQRSWLKNFTKFTQALLGRIIKSRVLTRIIMVLFWTQVMSRSCASAPLNLPSSPTIPSIAAPITIDEVRSNFPANSSATGPNWWCYSPGNQRDGHQYITPYNKHHHSLWPSPWAFVGITHGVYPKKGESIWARRF